MLALPNHTIEGKDLEFHTTSSTLDCNEGYRLKIMSLLEDPRPLYEALIPLLDVLKTAVESVRSDIYPHQEVCPFLERM